MTLPRPRRKIDLNGKVYPYILRFPQKRFSGLAQSPATCRLILQLTDSYVAVTLTSKHWEPDHEEGWMLPPHKVAMKPSDVKEILTSVLKLGKPTELPDWTIKIYVRTPIGRRSSRTAS